MYSKILTVLQTGQRWYLLQCSPYLCFHGAHGQEEMTGMCTDYYNLSSALIVCSFWTPIVQMLVCLMLSQSFSSTVFIVFYSFYSFCSMAVISTNLSSSILIHSSESFILILIPFSVFSFQLLYFFSFIFISWRLITLQYCSGFCHTLT